MVLLGEGETHGREPRRGDVLRRRPDAVHVGRAHRHHGADPQRRRDRRTSCSPRASTASRPRRPRRAAGARSTQDRGQLAAARSLVTHVTGQLHVLPDLIAVANGRRRRRLHVHRRRARQVHAQGLPRRQGARLARGRSTARPLTINPIALGVGPEESKVSPAAFTGALMLLSRFWYIFLAVAAAAATAAALLAQSVINGRSDEALADSLRRDRTMVDAVLRLEARSRLDRIAFITVDTKLGALLKQAARRHRREEAARAQRRRQGRAARARHAHGRSRRRRRRPKRKRAELEPDIVFALDGDGRIIAQLGPLEANPPGAGLAHVPARAPRAAGLHARRRLGLRPPRVPHGRAAGDGRQRLRRRDRARLPAREGLAGKALGVPGRRDASGSSTAPTCSAAHIPSDVAGAPQAAEIAERGAARARRAAS